MYINVYNIYKQKYTHGLNMAMFKRQWRVNTVYVNTGKSSRVTYLRPYHGVFWKNDSDYLGKLSRDQPWATQTYMFRGLYGK